MKLGLDQEVARRAFRRYVSLDYPALRLGSPQSIDQPKHNSAVVDGSPCPACSDRDLSETDKLISNPSSSCVHGCPAFGGRVPRRRWAALILRRVSADTPFRSRLAIIAAMTCAGRLLPFFDSAILRRRSGSPSFVSAFCRAARAQSSSKFFRLSAE